MFVFFREVLGVEDLPYQDVHTLCFSHWLQGKSNALSIHLEELDVVRAAIRPFMLSNFKL